MLNGEPARWEIIRPDIYKQFGPAAAINGAVGVAMNSDASRYLICEWEEVCLWDAEQDLILDKVPASNPIAVKFLDDEKAVFFDDHGMNVMSVQDFERGNDSGRFLEVDSSVSVNTHDLGFCPIDIPTSDLFPVVPVPRKKGLDLFRVGRTGLRLEKTLEHFDVNNATVSPDGRWLVLASQGRPGFQVIDLDQSRMPKFIQTEEPILEFCFDEASKRLLAGGSLSYRWYDVPEIKELGRYTSQSPAGQNPGMAWSPDGTLIALGQRADLIDVLDPLTGELLLSLPVKQNGSWVRFTPDCSSLLCRDSSYRLVIWNLARLREELSGLGIDW